MRFQLKMILIYAVFILFVGIALATAYHEYSMGQYRKTEEKSLTDISQQLVNQMEELIKPMETRARYILSDPEILESIRILSLPDVDKVQHFYLDEAERTIQTGLSLDYVMNDFFRVIFFNQNGCMVASTSTKLVPAVTSFSLEQMPWLRQADSAKGKSVLITAHADPWALRETQQVFSLFKAVQGKDMGYIEVQRSVDELAASIQLPKENLSVAVFLNDNDFLYSNNPALTHEAWERLYTQADSAAGVQYLTFEGEKRLVAKRCSDAYAITVVVLEDMEVIEQGSAYIAPFTVGITLVFCVISLTFVVLVARYLTKPIRQLRMLMERTSLENLGQEQPLSLHINELEALNVSYQNVLDRLQESMRKEKQMSTLQIRAHFDLLQAQVNPHFLYNILNVIAARGLQIGDEEICGLCSGLATILRYSTDTRQRYATIESELEYLEQYFMLLKSRYKHKLSFTVQVDPEIYDQVIPKIALQQIVENCINHGFANSTSVMEVSIFGWREGNRWYLKVNDNGQGFEEEKLADIRRALEKTKFQILHERANVELCIGGMGLVNTYARLLLLYGEELSFELKNTGGGAMVVFGTRRNEGGVQDV